MSNQQLVPIKELAEEAPVTLMTIRKWIREKRLPVVRLGKRVFVRREVIDKMLTEGLDAVNPEGN